MQKCVKNHPQINASKITPRKSVSKFTALKITKNIFLSQFTASEITHSVAASKFQKSKFENGNNWKIIKVCSISE